MEKEHQPTPKKLEKARKAGQVSKSAVLTRGISLIAAFIIIFNMLPAYWVELRLLLEYCLNSPANSPGICSEGGSKLAFLFVSQVLFGTAIVTVLVEYSQVGIRIDCGVLGPKLGHLNPLSGIRRICTGFKDIGVRLLFVLIVIILTSLLVNREVIRLVNDTMTGKLPGMQGVVTLLLALAVTLFAYGSFDLYSKRRRFFKEQSMTTREIRDEYREAEGDPQFKCMRKAMHEELALEELVARVKAANVIIVERA